MCSVVWRVLRFRIGCESATATFVSSQRSFLRKVRVVPSALMVPLERFPRTVEAIVLAAFEAANWRGHTR